MHVYWNKYYTPYKKESITAQYIYASRDYIAIVTVSEYL